MAEATTPITVDGNLTVAEWGSDTDPNWIPMTVNYYLNPTDITEAYYQVKWNDAANKIYVAVRVTGYLAKIHEWLHGVS